MTCEEDGCDSEAVVRYDLVSCLHFYSILEPYPHISPFLLFEGGTVITGVPQAPTRVAAAAATEAPTRVTAANVTNVTNAGSAAAVGLVLPAGRSAVASAAIDNAVGGGDSSEGIVAGATLKAPTAEIRTSTVPPPRLSEDMIDSMATRMPCLLATERHLFPQECKIQATESSAEDRRCLPPSHDIAAELQC